MRHSYERAGSGPPVVLLHGAFSDRHEWRAQIEDLRRDHTVIAWDAPPEPDWEVADYVDALAALLAEQGIARACVCGLSFGGGLALELHRRHPHLVASLILVSSYAGWGGSLPPDEVRRRIEDSGHTGIARSFGATDLRPHLPAVDVPTLVVHGTQDPRAPRPVAEALAAGIPGARLVTIDAGHELNTEAPEALTREIRAFLR